MAARCSRSTGNRPGWEPHLSRIRRPGQGDAAATATAPGGSRERQGLQPGQGHLAARAVGPPQHRERALAIAEAVHHRAGGGEALRRLLGRGLAVAHQAPQGRGPSGGTTGAGILQHQHAVR
ncbi:MAG: hypothetical protein ACK56I_09220, partial [bacterium]